MEKRGSGILLHITSLPSRFGIGDLGPGAYGFVDFLKEARQGFWQILPLNITSPAYGNSPYSSFSAFAGNPLLISPELMVRDGFLSQSDIRECPVFPVKKVSYTEAAKFKTILFFEAYNRNSGRLAGHAGFRKFCDENSGWLDDYTLFISLKNHFSGAVWNTWPAELRDREKGALEEWKTKLSGEISREKFLQYLFFTQWHALRDHCNANGVRIIGDIPIYVNYDSCDVWSNPDIFCLDEEKRPSFVAGVPPDYFSSTGQLWGHPVYKWDVLKSSCHSWWIERIGRNLELFHMFRLDHFRGFVGFWKVDAHEKTAINGEWVKAPAEDFFNTVLKRFPGISIIAEDLGIITPDVREIMTRFGLPGMKVLLFAFGEDVATNPYAPHNHVKNCVVYTGTHDNNTVRGWFKNELDAAGKKRVSEYTGRNVTEKTVHNDIITLAMMSVADMVIIPMQDILGLGGEHRMNLPASPSGNWQWRVAQKELSPAAAE
ncbi:MAG: 4-alpha-glucanotransferase, partial [Nitrospirota bacterium]|nr:4-alpha-glucanotransferase [Nitrospirota bacterium]